MAPKAKTAEAEALTLAEQLLKRTTREQGLSERVTDPAQIARIVAIPARWRAVSGTPGWPKGRPLSDEHRAASCEA